MRVLEELEVQDEKREEHKEDEGKTDDQIKSCDFHIIVSLVGFSGVRV